MKRYFVYMLQCFDRTYYVGVTNDVDRRFAQHRSGVDSECYTFERRPLRLIHVSEFTEIDQAIAFEKKLKGWSHRKKRAFASGDFGSIKRFSRGSNRED
ncbi:MAG TPA: GIY-YIG nuclease family protein [Candidatus Aquilonibacter sp.]